MTETKDPAAAYAEWLEAEKEVARTPNPVTRSAVWWAWLRMQEVVMGRRPCPYHFTCTTCSCGGTP